jgi:hypothetical protein
MSHDTHEVRLERLLGKVVRDREGRKVGHLEEVCIEKQNGAHVVVEYLIGAWGWLERISLARFRHPPGAHGWRARWDQLDLRHPDGPVLTCEREALERIGPGKAPARATRGRASLRRRAARAGG